MFFLLSKLLWAVTAPVSVLLVLACAGTLAAGSLSAGKARAGRRVALAATVALLACGVLPLGLLILRPLEDRFPQVPADFPAPTGFVVLGGSTDEALDAARGQVTVSTSADRVTEAVVMARRYPQARVVFSGGSGALVPTGLTEAEETRRLWIAMGIAPERITIENRSRNTDENARFTTALVRPQPGDTWLLVTSAFHVPRAVGLFRASGFPVVPYPVDYRTAGTGADWWPSADLSTGLQRLDFAVHEWVGLVSYWIAGKTSALFPAPEPVHSEP